ncbi:hypothetical protein DNFV4_03654 [Nitrospira tepida]|uniref:Cytochrome c domain-containing protein n=1 Tax=Nitrospira tepida TaxID=2973512 RepID=A0AA86N1Z8_9BACT|nr:c-type cytochrome [Nitrospira tepida]CAI4033220.1 hypothetical protein DNFV4_03654 [Nitrospira tepida]
MDSLTRRAVWTVIAAVSLAPLVGAEVIRGPFPGVSREFPEARTPKPEQRLAERGQTIFNSTGICFYCHGIEAFVDRRPNLSKDTEAIIQRLTPKPSDLRRPSSLKLRDDAARFRLIREGHEGTGMFPDTRLTDDDIRALLAYLALLRESAGAQPRSR